MTKTALILILSLLTFGTVLSQSSVYMVCSEGTKLYLGGSIHLLREQDYPLPQEFDTAFNKSEILVLETDINEINKPDQMRTMMGYTLLPNGITLNSLLSEEVYRNLETACKRAGLPLSQMNNVKPVVPILALTMIELGKMGVSSKGVDMHFSQKAIEKNRDMLFLETIDFQLKLIGNMADGMEDDFVKYSLEDLNNNKELFAELIESWRKGNSKDMEDQVSDFQTRYPKLYTKLLKNRNIVWVKKLENYLNTSETELVIVGAMHLYGKEGLIQLLRDKGYNVEQLK